MAMVRIDDETRDELRRYKAEYGYTYDEAITKLLKTTGNIESESKPWRNEDTLRHLHHDSEMSMSEMGEELGCTASTVKRWLKRNDIEIRSNAHAPAGEDHPLYQGGKETRKYYGDSKEKMEQRREYDNHTCQGCGKTQDQQKDDNGKSLHVHHINEQDDRDNPGEASISDLITVCPTCHKIAERKGVQALDQR